MSNYAKYQIEKEVVSVDNGQTWEETGNKRHGKILDVYPSLAACEDTDCDLKMSRLEMYSGELPQHLCGDNDTVYHEWIPQGILQEGTFSGGLMGCNGIYDSAPAYLIDNVATNCGNSIKIGDIICTPRDSGGVEQMYCRSRFNSFGDGKGVVLGTKFNCCECCFVGACADLIPQKLFPWVDKDNTLMLKISHYTKEHCSEDWVLESEDLTNIIVERWVVVGIDQTNDSRLWQHQIASELYTEEEAATFGENCQNAVKSWENVDDPINEKDYLLEWIKNNTNIYNIPYLNTVGSIKIPRITLPLRNDSTSTTFGDYLGMIEMIQDPSYSGTSTERAVESDYYEFHYKAGNNTIKGSSRSYVEIENLGTAQFPILKAHSVAHTWYGNMDVTEFEYTADLSISTPSVVQYWEYHVNESTYLDPSGTSENTICSDKGVFITKIWSEDKYGNYLHYLEPVHVEYEWMPQDLRNAFSFEYLHDRVDGKNYDNGYNYIYKCADDNWYWDNDRNKMNASATTIMMKGLTYFDRITYENNCMFLENFVRFKSSSDHEDTMFEGIIVPRNLKSMVIQDGIETITKHDDYGFLHGDENHSFKTLDFGESVSSITSRYILGTNIYIENFKKLIFRSITPPTISIESHYFWDMEDNGATLRIDFGVYVPDQSIEAYTNALPSYLRPYIKPLSEANKEYKGKLVYSFGNEVKIRYDETPTLKQSEIRGGSSSYENISYAEIYDNQTTIGSGAFQGCTSLENVNIPKTIVSVKDNAFNGCNALQKLVFPIEDATMEVGINAFDSLNLYPIVLEGDTYVNTMNASQNLRSYSSRVFPDVDTFRIIVYNKLDPTEPNYYKYETMSNNITSDIMDDYSGFFTTLYVSSAVTNLDKSMFSGCSYIGYIEEIRFYNGESSITSMTPFDYAEGLKTYGPVGSGANVEIPSSVTCVSGRSNTIITEAVLPSTVKTLDFQECHNLTKCIAAGVTSISFNGSSGITSVGEIGSGADVELGSSLTEIRSYAFYNCASLSSVTIPNGATSVGSYAFQSCRGLVNVTIPDSVTSIGESAFYGCSGLTNVVIGSGVTIINNFVFYNCTSLISLTIKATTPPSLGYDVFTNTNDFSIYVLSQCVDTYKKRWPKYASRIQAIQ